MMNKNVLKCTLKLLQFIYTYKVHYSITGSSGFW